MRNLAEEKGLLEKKNLFSATPKINSAKIDNNWNKNMYVNTGRKIIKGI